MRGADRTDIDVPSESHTNHAPESRSSLALSVAVARPGPGATFLARTLFLIASILMMAVARGWFLADADPHDNREAFTSDEPAHPHIV